MPVATDQQQQRQETIIMEHMETKQGPLLLRIGTVFSCLLPIFWHKIWSIDTSSQIV